MVTKLAVDTVKFCGGKGMFFAAFLQYCILGKTGREFAFAEGEIISIFNFFFQLKR